MGFWDFLLHPIRTTETALNQKVQNFKDEAKAEIQKGLQVVKPYVIALAVYLVVLEITVAIGAVALVKLAFFN